MFLVFVIVLESELVSVSINCSTLIIDFLSLLISETVLGDLGCLSNSDILLVWDFNSSWDSWSFVFTAFNSLEYLLLERVILFISANFDNFSVWLFKLSSKELIIEISQPSPFSNSFSSSFFNSDSISVILVNKTCCFSSSSSFSFFKSDIVLFVVVVVGETIW